MKGSSVSARNGMNSHHMNALVFFRVRKKTSEFWSKQWQGFQPVSSWYRRTLPLLFMQQQAERNLLHTYQCRAWTYREEEACSGTRFERALPQLSMCSDWVDGAVEGNGYLSLF